MMACGLRISYNITSNRAFQAIKIDSIRIIQFDPAVLNDQFLMIYFPMYIECTLDFSGKHGV